ncbi:hypothetical protein [Spirosoma sordidisoli]|uniref:Uncharacterized protein n=1 Tax=Spirosoma sordidisoli TaxID=2502893 RepID=A0A4Q2US01_9BACT|nr:hypothetical protein [Spirosoma sordidisoli]RYC69609.1 hypothetical protein EQG79_13480 [Spirosoma sordidisoli]
MSLNIDQTGEEATLAELYANAPLKSVQKEARRIGFASPANKPVEPKVPPMPTPAERRREDEEDGLLALERLSSDETRITSEDVKKELSL